ncbi:MAG: hypothetical protein U9Q99_02980 [Nanoarchaeota archaeon]|nr:hypothetical protein [Nanoarchaeota archaeon]
MERGLKITIYILVIFILVMFISNYFFSYNPVFETEKKVNNLVAESKINKTVKNGVTLKVDSPEYLSERFDDIDYSVSFDGNDTDSYIKINFFDTTGYLNDKCYSVIQSPLSLNPKELCKVCSEELSGELKCIINDYSGGMLNGEFKAYGGGDKWIVGNDMNLETELVRYYRENGYDI